MVSNVVTRPQNILLLAIWHGEYRTHIRSTYVISEYNGNGLTVHYLISWFRQPPKFGQLAKADEGLNVWGFKPPY